MITKLHNFYAKMKKDVSENLDEFFGKDYTIQEDVNKKNLVIDLKEELLGDARAMFEECLKVTVTFFRWDLHLKEKPKYAFISPTSVTVQKAFTDADFRD